ncbi:MAG: hypothetical protein R3F11_18165, partial [Verrucomicrobiales bacterium]
GILPIIQSHGEAAIRTGGGGMPRVQDGKSAVSTELPPPKVASASCRSSGRTAKPPVRHSSAPPAWPRIPRLLVSRF